MAHLPLHPWSGEPGRGRTTLRSVTDGGQLALGVSLPGQAELRGGLVNIEEYMTWVSSVIEAAVRDRMVDPARVRDWIRELIRRLNEMAMSQWDAVPVAERKPG